MPLWAERLSKDLLPFTHRRHMIVATPGFPKSNLFLFDAANVNIEHLLISIC